MMSAKLSPIATLMMGLIFTSNQRSLSAEKCPLCPLVKLSDPRYLLTNNASARIDVQASWKIPTSQVEFSSDIKRTYSSPVSNHSVGLKSDLDVMQSKVGRFRGHLQPLGRLIDFDTLIWPPFDALNWPPY